MTVDDFLERLDAASDVRWAWDVLDEWLAAGKHDLLEEVLVRMQPHLADPQHWQSRSITEAIESRLAFDPAGPETLVRLVSRAAIPPGTVPRLAAMLACGQTVDALDELLARHAERDGPLELFACLVSEMALRGATLRRSRGAPILSARLAERAHPLAPLPWEATAIESRCADAMPGYSKTGGSGPSMNFGPRNHPPMPDPGPREPVTLAAHEDGAAIDALHTTFEGFGEPDAGVFRADAELRPLSRHILARVPLPCLANTPVNEIYMEALPPEEAFALLLGAGLGGIPYHRSLDGAWSRLSAWNAVRAFAGLDLGARLDVAAVEGAARRCEWFYFDAHNEWFIQEYCDLGLVAVRPDGRTLALAAGTATD